MERLEPIKSVKIYYRTNAQIICLKTLANPSGNTTLLFQGRVMTKSAQIFHDSWTMKIIIMQI